MTLQNVEPRKYNDSLLNTLIECAELLGYECLDDARGPRGVVEQLYAVDPSDLQFKIYLWESITISGAYRGDQSRTWTPCDLESVYYELVTFLEEAYGASCEIEINQSGHNVAWITCGGREWSISAERDDVYTMFFELFISFMRSKNAR